MMEGSEQPLDLSVRRLAGPSSENIPRSLSVHPTFGRGGLPLDLSVRHLEATGGHRNDGEIRPITTNPGLPRTPLWEGPRQIRQINFQHQASESPVVVNVSENTTANSKKRKRPEDNELLKALEAINNCTLSIYAAAKHYGIPRTTLQYRLSKQFKNKGTRGPHTIFTPDEEDELVTWLKDKEDKGYPVTVHTLTYKVKNFLTAFPRQTPFTNNIPGKTWINLFLKRHPTLTLRTPESVTLASSKVTEKEIRLWFQKLRNYLVEHDLIEILNDPTRVLNGDESGFPLNPVPKKVFGSKGNKNVSFVETTNSKFNITVMFSFIAEGTAISPYIILTKKRPGRDILRSIPEDWVLGYSENGWMDTRNFIIYIKKVLYPALKKKGTKFPVVFFVDGHSSHLALEAADVCLELGIILIALFPNATRILQPADVAMFRPLKISWCKAVDIWRVEHPGERLSERTFGPLLQKSMDEALKKCTIINGFSACGLYPFNPDAIDYSKCLSASKEDKENSSNAIVNPVCVHVPDPNSPSFTALNLDVSDGNQIDLSVVLGEPNGCSSLIVDEPAMEEKGSNISIFGALDDNINDIPVVYDEPNGCSSIIVDDRAMEMALQEPIVIEISSNLQQYHLSDDDMDTTERTDDNTAPTGNQSTLTSLNDIPVVFDESDGCSTKIVNDQAVEKALNAPNVEILSCGSPIGSNDVKRHDFSTGNVFHEHEEMDTDTTTKHAEYNMDTPANRSTLSSLKEFLSIPKSPKREKKHRNYKQRSHIVLTAGERLQELREIQKMKEEAVRMRAEKAEIRKQKMIMAEEEKKMKLQRSRERLAMQAEKKKIKQEEILKRKMEREEKKKSRDNAKQLKTREKQRRTPLSLLPNSNSGQVFVKSPAARVTAPVDTILETSDLSSVLDLHSLVEMEEDME